jgi:RNAse (barnase) inhibitor barstar
MYKVFLSVEKAKIPHNFWTKFGQNLDKIWTKFGQNLDKIWTKFGQNLDKIWTKFGNSDLSALGRKGR